MSRPLVSVVIDNFNYDAYLGEAIESALQQTWPHTEIIVVDDGSTDASRDIIASFGPALRPVFQENQGQAAALNTGVRHARGDYLCFLDSDDIWFPQKIERVVDAFRRHPSASWLRHRLQVVDASRQSLGAKLPAIHHERVQRPVPRAFIEGCFPAFTSGIALTRLVAEKVFPLPLATPSNGDFAGVDLIRDADAYMNFKAASTGLPFLSLPEVLGMYRRHQQQQYVGTADLERTLQRQIALAAGVATAFGGNVIASTIFKHRAILAAVRGRSILHRDRLLPLAEGFGRVLPLAAVSPQLFLRQALALSFAGLLPDLWIRKLYRSQGFTDEGKT